MKAVEYSQGVRNPSGESFKNKCFRWTHNVILVLSCCIVLYSLCANAFLPLQDYPQWLFQSKVLHQYFMGNPDWSVYYTVDWFPLPPNLLVTLMLASLQFLVPVLAAGRLFLIFYAVLFVFGWYYLFSVHHAWHPLRWLGLVFVQNHFFYLGFLSYELGLALLMIAAGWLSSRNDLMSRQTACGIFFISMVLFAVHVIAVGLFGIAVLIVLFLEYKRSGIIAWKIIVAILPSLVFVLIFLMNSRCGHGATFYPSLWIQILNGRYAIHVFNRLLPIAQKIPLSFLNAVVELFILGLGIVSYKKKWIDRHIPLFLAIAVLSMFMTIALPFSQIGEFGDINKRFVLPAVVFFFASQHWISRHRAVELAVVVLGLMAACMHQEQFASFDQEAKKINADVQGCIRMKNECIFVNRGFADEYDQRTSKIFSGIIRPLLHFQWYYNLDQPQKSTQSFETGLVHLRKNNLITIPFDAEQMFHDGCTSTQAVPLLQNRLENNDIKRSTFILIGTPSSLSILQKAFSCGYSPKPVISEYVKIFAANDSVKNDSSSYIDVDKSFH